MRLGVECPCPPVCNNIVTLPHLFHFSLFLPLFFLRLLPLCCFFFSAFSPWLFSFFFFLLSHLFLFSFLFLSFCFSFFLFFFSLSSSSLKSSEIPPDLPSSGATRYYRMYRSGRQYRNPFNLVHGFPTALACEAKRRR